MSTSSETKNDDTKNDETKNEDKQSSDSGSSSSSRSSKSKDESVTAGTAETVVGPSGVERVVSIATDNWSPAPVDPDKDEVKRMKDLNKKLADERKARTGGGS